MTKVVRNTLIYTLGNILPQAVAFLLLPIYTKHLPPSEYGIVNSMLVIQAFLAILFSFALDRSIIRLFWDYKNENDKKVFLGTISISIIAISILFLFLSLLFRDVLQKVFTDIKFYPYYFYTIITTFCFNLSLLSKNFYRLKNQANKYFILSAFELILITGFILWFIVSKEEMGLGVIKGKMIGFLILSPIYIVIVLRHIRIKFKWEMLKNALSFTLPIIPTLVAAWMIGQSDKIFIADYLSLEDVGIYSLSKRIASLIALVAGAFMLAYHPLYFEIANSDNQVRAKNKLYKYNNIFILSIIFISFLVVFFSKEMIYLFLNERYHESYKYIPWIAIAVLFGSVSSTTLGASFQQSKKMKQDMYIGIFAAVMTVGLYFLLISNFKLYGMIFATTLASITIFIIAYIYAKKKCFFIPINWKYVIRLVFCLSFLYMFFEYIVMFNLIYMFLLKIITILILLLITFRFYGKEILRLIKD